MAFGALNSGSNGGLSELDQFNIFKKKNMVLGMPHVKKPSNGHIQQANNL